MIFEVEASNKTTKRFIEAIMPSVINQLGMTRSKKSVIVSVSKNCEHSALMVPLPGIDAYFVGIKPTPNRPGEVTRSLCHEMVHVAQMAKGILRPVEGGNIWANKFFPEKTPYLDRPWELQAFAMQEIIMRRALEG